MTDEITATKYELANDLLLLISQNKQLIDKVNELQSQIKHEQYKLLKSTESEFFAKGRLKKVESVCRSAKNELKQAQEKIIKMENKQ
jgi:hypothetical protein